MFQSDYFDAIHVPKMIYFISLNTLCNIVSIELLVIKWKD